MLITIVHVIIRAALLMLFLYLLNITASRPLRIVWSVLVFVAAVSLIWPVLILLGFLLRILLVLVLILIIGYLVYRLFKRGEK